MSQQDLWAAVGRARTNSSFASQLFEDFDGALKANGYVLTPAEQQMARGAFSGAAGTPQPPQLPVQDIYDTIKLQNDETRKRMTAQNERTIDLNKFTANMLKETIGHSASTYKKITMMNQVMFWMGVSLFLFAVVYAVITKNLTYSIAFAGLGTASFIGFFFLGPIQETQTALSNLISAEIAFMNYFEQMGLIEVYAGLQREDSTGLPDPARLEKASEMMQMRSRQTIELLHTYLENRQERHDAPLARDDKAIPTVDPPASTTRPNGAHVA